MILVFGDGPLGAAVAAQLGARARLITVETPEIALVRRAVEATDAPTGLVWCVNGGLQVPLAEISESLWRETFLRNVDLAFFACQAVAPRMARGGNIVLLGLVDGARPVPAPAHVAATQGALVGLTRALAKELGPRDIRVNLVLMGVLDEGPAMNLPAHLLADYKAQSAQGRVGTIAEVAQAMAWLASENTYMTGQVVPVNGGL